ncbi:MAG: 4-hydroxythreonine-4-phosphate dehydrogenase PdxA [Alistipes sp.]|nr:4-hydroxythreonine-4-phosphate dehydrogenase PdxA [Alistipes sp.]
MSNNRLKIGITQGDINGVGWEIILHTLSDSRITELFTPVVYGSSVVAQKYMSTLDEEEGKVVFNIVASAAEAQQNKINLVECGEAKPTPGVASKEGGKAAVEALERAVADLKSGEIDAMVTAPFDKEMAQSEEFKFTGHTEFVASHLEGEPMMIMCSDRLRVGLVTIHIPVAEVSKSISQEKIVAALTTLRKSLKEDFGIVEPRIAVLALNPHAGEGGMLGSEEQEIIKPAIVEAFESGILAFGPFPADGLFAAGGYTKYDAVLAMYHDQGLTPFKTLSPDGVNFTAGLSAVRTSPDHGTAYDIAGKGVADPQSMRNAIYTAIDIVRNREAWAEWSANPLQRFEREKGRDVSVKDLKLPEQEEE